MSKSALGALGVISLLVISNLIASLFANLGDAESLYYCYGKHPSLSYLDHPPLIGWLIHVSTATFGDTVFSVRIVSALATALSVLFTYILAKEVYDRRAGLFAAILLGTAPVFSVGMVAATPDTPLAVLWPLYTWQLYLAGKDDGKGLVSTLGRPLLLGALLGLSFLAKYTGAVLVLTTLILVATKPYRGWLKRPGFYLGIAAAAALASPVFIWNLTHDFAGVSHRLVWTQTEAGFSFRNLGALIGGQLLYMGPLALGLMGFAAVHIFKKRKKNLGSMVLLAASAPALVLTYLLALWSRVAEPHWPAVAYIPLFVAAGGLATQSERAAKFAKASAIFGVIALAALHVAVLTPLLPAVTPEDAYERKYDLGNELRGWPEVAAVIRESNDGKTPVVAAFYTQCAQLAFALSAPDDPPVRCVSPEVNDFDIWHPDFSAASSDVMFVTDNRFDHSAEELFPAHIKDPSPRLVAISRGGVCVREFEIHSLKSPR